MEGSKKVITELQKLLRSELSARDQYFTHSRMYQDWGLHKLYERIDHEMQDETQHADMLIKRILFLGGSVDLGDQADLRVGATVPEMLKKDLEVEYEVIDNLKSSIAVCEQEQDYVSRDLLRQMLDDTEQDHAHWLEQQLWLIDNIGLPNYLQSQMS
ncbi:bacterioferritin [Cyanobacterium stanieri LEGE 03274]|uniref:Bacterioferritin n=1 Tax=Cyanobacterium stanieri LEGE 03274 TaxID=1828756 RepID=A0ABR9VAG4_9CHRO|nr:bacterioferritin [Cyanobacterium stanieri]MBE9223834.1 bacterioferritin [Cyanobacterium stanieri LEGE 03274]